MAAHSLRSVIILIIVHCGTRTRQITVKSSNKLKTGCDNRSDDRVAHRSTAHTCLSEILNVDVKCETELQFFPDGDDPKQRTNEKKVAIQTD